MTTKKKAVGANMMKQSAAATATAGQKQVVVVDGIDDTSIGTTNTSALDESMSNSSAEEVAPGEKNVETIDMTEEIDNDNDTLNMKQSKATMNKTTKNNEIEQETIDDFFHQYNTFTMLYMLACLIHFRNYYEEDVVVTGAHLLAMMFFRRNQSYQNGIFLSFLFSVIYSTWERTPYLANHANVVGFISLLLIPAQIRRCYYGSTDPRSYQSVKDALNVIRWAVIIMYWFAGFHKLNDDFLNPKISCAFDKIFPYFALMGYDSQEDLVDLPFGMAYKLPVMVLVLEFFAPVLLYYSSTQWIAVIIMLKFHLILLPMGFSDFGSIACSLLLLFISPKAFRETEFPKNYFYDMAGGFIFLEIISMAVWYFKDSDHSPMRNEEAAAVLIAYGIIWAAVFRTKSLTTGPGMYIPKSWASRCSLLAFVFFAMNPYLGLRTTGNLTMFSNLRTEGPVSNHLLFRNNPLKVFDYQEDTIRVWELDERWIRTYRGTTITPKHEFLLEVYWIKEELGDDIEGFYANLEYNGIEYETDDFFYDEDMAHLREDLSWWERKYFRFRPVNPVGEPQQCSW